MKNISKTIAAFSLSLLTVGVMAQAPANMPKPSHKVTVKAIQNSHNVTAKHKVAATAVGGMIDYVDGDAANKNYTFWNGSSGNYTAWAPIMYMNSQYTAADTGVSPLTSNAGNTYTANDVAVAYDTLWDEDAYLNTGIGIQTVWPGSLSIDTIWAILGYHNTSGTNDTIIFTVTSVTAKGMPTYATVYQIDTEVIAPHSAIMPGTSLDSNVEVGFIPATPINIPATAAAGWHFCIHMTVHGSKLDTLGTEYYSAFVVSGGGAYSDSITSLGGSNGTNPIVPSDGNILSNSFITGLYWFNSADFGGPTGQVTWPIETPAANAGQWKPTTGGQYFYYFQPSGTSGFVFYPGVQNLGILASVDYINTTGVNKVASTSGLSVGQNYPNPFNQMTTINYSLTKASDVTFTVYDITGRVITNNNYGNVAAGQYNINLNANTFSPGIYFYSFNVNGSVVTKKMVITN